MSRYMTWFATKNGKKVTHTCVGIVGFSIFGSQIAFHGPLQQKFKNLVQMYRKGEAKPLSPELKELTTTVLNDSTLDEKQKAKVEFFNVIGHDLFHIGGINSPWGAMVGLPFYFDNAKNIDFSQLRLEGHDSIDWIIDGQDFMASLNLSHNAKKFGAMRELYSCEIMHILDNACISTSCFLFPAEVARRVNAARGAFEKSSLQGRIIFYCACFALGFMMYKCLSDPMRHLSMKKYDNLAASAGRDYLEGGIEFYEKSLQRNKALREMLGEKGERRFNKDGSENYWMFAPRLPTKKRLELLQEIKDNLSENTLVTV